MESKVEDRETPGVLPPMACIYPDDTTDSESSRSVDLGSPALRVLTDMKRDIMVKVDCPSRKPIEHKHENKSSNLYDPTPRDFDDAGTPGNRIFVGGQEILSHVDNEEKTFALDFNEVRGVLQPNRIVSGLENPNHAARRSKLDSLMAILVCPITKRVFQDPCTLVADGLTYEKGALVAWLQLGYDISPTTGEKLYGTAFADSKIIKRLLSEIQSDDVGRFQFTSEWLRKCVRLRYQTLTSSLLVTHEEIDVSGSNLAGAAGQPEAVGRPNFVSNPTNNRRHHTGLDSVNRNNRASQKQWYSSTSVPPSSQPHLVVCQSPPHIMKSVSHPPTHQSMEMATLSASHNYPHPTTSRPLQSNLSLPMPQIERMESYSSVCEELLKRLSRYPQRGTWTMEESTNFWYVRLEDDWQGPEFRNWIVRETENAVGNVRDKKWHKLAEEWAEKLNMRRASIGWFTPPFYGDLKIPLHNSVKNPSKEFKKGETVRFNLERLLIREATSCRYGPDDGNLPKHLPHQTIDNGRSSYATAMCSVSVKFVRDDVMPETETGEYYCNIACYGVRGALAENVINLSKEGGLQPGEIPSSRLSELMQKISQTDSIGTLVQRGSKWFCVLRKVWQDKREQFLNQAKKDFKEAEFYHKFLVPYRKCTFYSKFCKDHPEEDFMKWRCEDKEFQVELGELDSSILDNVNTINFNIPYLQYAIEGEQLKINAKVIFPDLSRSGCDDGSYHFTIATVVPSCSLKESPTPRPSSHDI